MKMFTDRMRASALVGSLLATAALAVPCLAEGDKCDCPAKQAAKSGVPMLSQVPYIGRLFRVCEPCEGDFERIGVDFEFCTEGEFPFAVKFWECGADCEGGQCKAKACCAEGQCKANAAACECPVAKTTCQSCQVAAKTACACEARCACDSKCACESKVAHASKCACGETCQCGDHVVAHPFGPVPFIAQHLPPHAIVAHHGPAHPPVGACPGMLEHLLALTAKSAALEAKLEARTEQAELVSEMLELAQENARLKAQVELAEAKSELAQQVLTVTLENEQLKSKLAELTGKLQAADVQTTERPRVLNAPR
jgi:hypothetical protein